MTAKSKITEKHVRIGDLLTVIIRHDPAKGYCARRKAAHVTQYFTDIGDRTCTWVTMLQEVLPNQWFGRRSNLINCLKHWYHNVGTEEPEDKHISRQAFAAMCHGTLISQVDFPGCNVARLRIIASTGKVYNIEIESIAEAGAQSLRITAKETKEDEPQD